LFRRNQIRAGKLQLNSRRSANREKGVELLELALVLPLLFVLLVGILFYGRAWATKDVLAGATRDGARVAVNNFNDTTNPQCAGATPCSVQSAASVVVAAIGNANVDTCDMVPSTNPPASTGAFTWTYTSGGCASSGQPWTMVIERAVPQTVGGVNVMATRITLSYPYAWNFVAVNPFGSPIMVGTQAMMTNLN
jgi:Flp pilus assembly protein TadG